MFNELTAGDELDFEKELDETQRSLREITLMIEQSQGELSKLTQRNAAITTHLQQVQNQLDRLPQLWMLSSACSSCAVSSKNCRRRNPISNATNRPLSGRVLRWADPAQPRLPSPVEEEKVPWQTLKCWSMPRRPNGKGFRARCMTALLRHYQILFFKLRSQCACSMWMPPRPAASSTV